MGENDPPGIIDDGPPALRIKGRRHVGGRPALAAETRHEEPRARHGRPQLGQLPGIGRAHDGPHGPVSIVALGHRGQAFHELGHVPIDRLAVGHQVLDHPPAGVGRLHQDEQSGLMFRGHLDERLQAVIAQVRTDRQGIGAPGAFASQEAAGVGRGGRSNVVAFAVDDHHQPLLLGVAHGAGQRRHSGRSQFLEEGRLGLDGGHAACDDVDDFAAELLVGRGDFLRPHRVAGGQQPPGKHIGPGIESHEHRVFATDNGRFQSIGKC